MIQYTDSLQRNDPDYPIVDSSDIKGGLHTVRTLNDLNSIKGHKLTDGMLCYISTLDSYYMYRSSEWTKANFSSSGVPIYNRATLDDIQNPPADSIIFRDPEDLSGSTENKTITTSFNGTYLDILFSAIRSLQSEVAKLRNSFKYGITSFTETNTAMSNVMGELSQDPESEPLWAVEEDSLSSLEACTISMDYNHTLVGTDIVSDNEKELLTITGNASFSDPIEDGFKVQKDPKSFLYLTSTEPSISIVLSDLTNNEFTISLDSLLKSKVKLYNILIVVSKKTVKDSIDINLYGKNYVWIQITDGLSNTILCSGYYSNNTLSNNIVELDTQYYIKHVHFKDLVLSKFNAYTKAQDFSYEVIPTYPTEDKYKFSTAHLTIRSVSTQLILDQVQNQLLENELIWVEELRKLCIKSKGKIFTISGTSINDDTTMTTDELIGSLKNMGIIVNKTTDSAGNEDYNLELADLTGITFIHEDTNTSFDISIDSEGNLRSTPIDTNYLKDRIAKVSLTSDSRIDSQRGFIANLRIAESGAVKPKDAGLRSDRLKIGAIYAPIVNRTLYGCSHAYVELENTSDQDINLSGCTLYVLYKETESNGGEEKLLCLSLTGVVKAGGTYLIRGKKYASFEDVNTVIKVKSFDQEWYDNGTLVDFQKPWLAFALLYDPEPNNEKLKKDSSFVASSADKSVNWNFIDVAYVRASSTDVKWWSFTVTDSKTTRDYILKNTFELDPAKQAFQALVSTDSSRIRGANKNDFKPFYIDTPIISFPNSTPTYDVSLITPKASFENKNVSTDKTKLDINKPNMVYCAFGIDMHKTRCFNWISVGSFDEFLWVRQQGTDTWQKFESYKQIDTIQEPSIEGEVLFYRKEFDPMINNHVYAQMSGRFPGDNSYYTAHKCIIELKQVPDNKTVYEYRVGRALINGEFDPEHSSPIQTFTIYPYGTRPKVYHITDQQGFYWMEYQTWAGSARAIANKIASDTDTIPVIINTGDITQNGTRVNEWLDYYLAGYDLFKQYEHMSVVGNNDLCGTDPGVLGTGDDVGKSNGYYHHLFNCYEIQDESLVVNGKYVPSTYYFDCKNSEGQTAYRYVNVNSEITFINCRDWFNLNVEGNTDIAYNIYTGWTVGNTQPASPVYYADQFEHFTPIYNTLYNWMNSQDFPCIVSCHEIPFTVMTKDNLTVSTNSATHYTDYSRSLDGSSGNLVGSHLNQLTKNDTCCLYWFSRLLEHCGVKLVLGGHKHTYTCTYPVREFYFYYKITNGQWDENLTCSYDEPMIMVDNLSNEYNSEQNKFLTSWEYYFNDPDHPQSFEVTQSPDANFSTDKTVFIPEGKQFHTSRLPIVKYGGQLKKEANDGKSSTPYTSEDLKTEYLPIVSNRDMNNGITYFMCQATGYKQTSNKELPGTSQAFTMLLPKTTYNGTKATASAEQQVPMFAIVEFDDENQAKLSLIRIMNVQAGKKSPLYNNTNEYGTGDLSFEYINAETSRFGQWGTDSKVLVTIKL